MEFLGITGTVSKYIFRLSDLKKKTKSNIKVSYKFMLYFKSADVTQWLCVRKFKADNLLLKLLTAPESLN